MSAEPIDAQYTAAPLAVTDPAPPQLFSAMPPAQKLVLARETATVLRDMLREGKVIIDGDGNEKRVPLIIRIPQKDKSGRITGYSEHVEVEGWLTCGMLANATAPIRWTKPLDDGQGFTAFAEVVWQGQVVGAGEGHCDRNERRWKFADDYAIKSMAQTRAQSKALRGVFAWIMVLAGFSPTPAAEMTEDMHEPRKPPKPRPPAEPVTATREQSRHSDEYLRKLGVGEVHRLLEKRGIPDCDYREVLIDTFGPTRFRVCARSTESGVECGEYSNAPIHTSKEAFAYHEFALGDEIKPSSKVLELPELRLLWTALDKHSKTRA